MAEQKDGGIAWTEQTWNPVRGCTRISEGCRYCYAETIAARFSGKDADGKDMAYAGLAKMTDAGPRWTGVVKLIEDHLEDPMRWQRPRRIFVNSMSDLFHEKLDRHAIARVFAVMAKAKHHQYQVLTKRADRMQPFFMSSSANIHFWDGALWDKDVHIDKQGNKAQGMPAVPGHIWLGVSVENQEAADARIPELLKVNAETRWLSIEPQIGDVDLSPWLKPAFERQERVIHWVVIGGESGHEARPFNIDWARTLIRQCRLYGVPVFMKQLGSCAGPTNSFTYTGKGGDPAEWPADLRVRQYPEVRHGA